MDEPNSCSSGSRVGKAGDAKTVAVFTKTMPHRERRGYLRYMYSIMQFLESRCHRVHIVLSACDVPFVFLHLGRVFPSERITIHAPKVNKIGRWHFVTHPTRLAKNILCKALAQFPRLGAIVKGRIMNMLGKSRHTTESASGARIIFDSPEIH